MLSPGVERCHLVLLLFLFYEDRQWPGNIVLECKNRLNFMELVGQAS